MYSTTGLNIVSVNIEKDRHFDRLMPFLKKQQPDVILLQEVLSKDIAYFEKSLEMKSHYAGLNHYDDGSQHGILTLSTYPLFKTYALYYRGDGDNLPLLKHAEPEKMARAILITEIIKDNQLYCLINTHFTWSPNGKPSVLQNEDINILMRLLSEIPEFVFCGDFNAPRGTPIFDTIASKYKDNVPAHIETTIDKNLHKAGDLKLVVDGIFSTPAYQINSVEIVDSLSDHCAILAKITKLDKPDSAS